MREAFASFYSFGKYKEDIIRLQEGLETAPPMFDKDLLTLLQVEGLGIKTVLLFMHMGITSIIQLLSKNATFLATECKIYCQNHTNHGKGMRAPSEKQILQFQFNSRSRLNESKPSIIGNQTQLAN